MNPIIKVKSLTKEYVNAEGTTLTVLDKVDLEIDEGSFVCMLGPSGCGKTTLLKLIGGFEKPTNGEIYIKDSLIVKPGIDRSMVFQTFEQLLPWKTVGGNIEYPLKINKIGENAAEREEIVHKFLSLVELEKFKNYYPHQISGGMKQRVAIARSLAQNPKVILMDEPFASLDAQTRKTLQEELFNICQKTDVTVIFVTHNIQESIVLASRIVVMSKSPSKICLDIENTVDSSDGLRYPGSKGYDECWKLLQNQIVLQSKN